MSTGFVIWQGARPRNQLKAPPTSYMTHADDCKWMLTLEARDGLSLPRLPAAGVPANVKRCRRCGGGR